jgi:hypothetical protein
MFILSIAPDPWYVALRCPHLDVRLNGWLPQAIGFDVSLMLYGAILVQFCKCRAAICSFADHYASEQIRMSHDSGKITFSLSWLVSKASTARPNLQHCLSTLNPPVMFTAWSLLLLETLFTVCLVATSYRIFGSGWGDLDILIRLNWSWLALQPLNGLGESKCNGYPC